MARPLAENGLLTPWDSVLAVSQWSGRGQLRRPWDSPPGNVYGALVLPAVPQAFDTLTPLILGRLACEFLAGLGVEACLKWPNDVICGGLKVCGMLVEERKGVTLAGIGVNLHAAPDPSFLRNGHAVPAGTLAGLGVASTPVSLWSALVDFVKTGYLDELSQGSPGQAAARTSSRLCWLGQEVLVRDGSEPPWTGRILGLAPDGALRVKPADGAGERLLTSGSIWRA
ncbi:biotin--[acetyl-CoA-carboxylase] ligase [Fundidesulfovibrio magnetotacticus]|uniref:biotin--[acetyl-CoA-carboxylase] ligase n=1 Tax=Fundidesulfovibrio magnetotacticus TaxID=2730080 RepID=UPI001F1FB686|nr:hypothetical protein [Fundidesulfovibrio magnetotacticus]